jgi:hypothetical protein
MCFLGTSMPGADRTGHLRHASTWERRLRGRSVGGGRGRNISFELGVRIRSGGNFEAMATPRWRRSPAPSSEHRSVLLRLRRVLGLGVILALVGGGCGSGGQLDAKALSHQLKFLQSEAAEGALLARDAASGRTTRTYTREHSTELYRAALQAEAMLNAATTEPALQPKLRQLVVLAGQVSAGLRRLGSASREEDGRLARQLEASQMLGESFE